MRSAPGWRRFLTLLFYALLAAFLVYYLRGVDWRALARLEVRPLYLLAALPISLGARFPQPLAWSWLLRAYGERPPPYPQLTLVYAKGWIGRYIPGSVAVLAGRVLFGSQYGVRPGVLAVTSVAEAGIQMITSLATAFLLFAVAGQLEVLGPGLRLFAVVAFLIMSAALAPPVFNALVAWTHRVVLKRLPSQDTYRVALRPFLRVAALYAVLNVVSALPLFLLLKAVYDPLSLAHFSYLTASFLLAGTLSTLAVFAPTGIGVREGILIVLISAVIPREVTVLAVVLLRLWTIAVDFAFYGLAALWERSRPLRAVP